MQDLPFFGFIRGKGFSEGSNSADMSDLLVNLLMISVEHYTMMKLCSKMFSGIGGLLI